MHWYLVTIKGKVKGFVSGYAAMVDLLRKNGGLKCKKNGDVVLTSGSKFEGVTFSYHQERMI